SPKVGKIVMEAAAKNLTPVTLELGGKSPAIIDETADVELAAKRIAWGKFVNAGQTCIAPDYVLVHESQQASFIEGLKDNLADFYGVGEDERRNSHDYCRIINERNFERLKALFDGTVAAGANVEIGGHFVASERYIAPTVLSEVPPDAPIM